MRKFAYFLIVLSGLLILVPFVLYNKNLFNQEKKEPEKTTVKDYNYISFNDLTENNKINVLNKLYSKSGTSEASKLKLNTQTYTIYEILSLDEVYKIKINKDKKLLTSNLDKIKNIDFYLINSMNYIVKLNFSYTRDNTPSYREDKITKKDNWTFYFDEKELTLFGHYKLSNGTFLVKIADGNLKDNKMLQNLLIETIINNIEITKDESNKELYTNSYNNSVTSYIVLSNEDSVYEIDKNITLDLNTNYIITNWSSDNNWPSNKIELVSRDYSNTFSIRESLDEYSLSNIKGSLKNNVIEEIDYNNDKVNIIYEINSPRIQGYIKKINNRSYTCLYNLNKSIITNTTNNDKTQFINFTETSLYKQ